MTQSCGRLDALSPEDAKRELLRCCGSTRWAERMAAARPFGTEQRLFALAEETWRGLSSEDWLEAFSHHPRIGDRQGLAGHSASTRAWAQGEQAGAAAAESSVLAALAEGNREYEARFGHVYLVCATGKSAEEMLALLRTRMGHAPEAELRVAAGEQEKITRLRLERLLDP